MARCGVAEAERQQRASSSVLESLGQCRCASDGVVVKVFSGLHNTCEAATWLADNNAGRSVLRMSSRAQLLIALLIFPLVPAYGGPLHLGAAVNIFSRYAYLSISMRVVPRNDTNRTWIFREPTVDVFKNSSLHPAALSIKELNQPRPIFTGDFHMEFCDNLKQLLQAYFREFNLENLDRPWRAFTGSWSLGAVAKHLGIQNATYLSSPYSYVLIRVARHHEKARLLPLGDEPELDEAVAREAETVKVGDTASVVNFVRSYGSHYIAAYVTGNSLYQVMVYTPEVYKNLKQKMKERGVAALSSSELASFFSPWYTEHIGRIQSASGNSTVENWALRYLRTHYYFFKYPSLLKLHGDASLLKDLDGILGNEALLQLDLRTLVPPFKDSKKKQWFLDVVDNYLKLWEVNM